jgi:pantoate--beta-alanine ligase
VQPHLAFFGEKDYQQLAIVRRVVRELNIPIKVVGVPTVRERDGLALSSRNRRLTLRQRVFAPFVYKALQAARKSIACGERNPAAVKARVARILHSVPDITLEYFDLVDPDTIRSVDVVQAPVRAAWRHGLAKRGLSIMFFASPRICQLNTARIMRKFTNRQQN